MKPVPTSWLFVPGSRPDRFSKAAASSAQALILDLEDAVGENDKDTARKNVVDFLSARPEIKQQICVRTNPLVRRHGIEDLAALSGLSRPADYLLIPKAEEPAELRLAGKVLADQNAPTALVALIESAKGINRAPELAQATTSLAAFLFGAADYAADIGQQVGRFDPTFARQAVVNAAASGGLAAIDSPFFDINDGRALLAECARSRAFGFGAKAAIHPSQLDPINETFSPTEEERDLARRIRVAAPEGVGVLDGKMIDIAMVRWAARIG